MLNREAGWYQAAGKISNPLLMLSGKQNVPLTEEETRLQHLPAIGSLPVVHKTSRPTAFATGLSLSMNSAKCSKFND